MRLLRRTLAAVLAVALWSPSAGAAQDPSQDPSDVMNALLGGLMGFREMTASELEKEVADIGGVPFRHEVPLDYLTKEDLGRYVKALLDEEYPESRARIDERTLQAFGLLEPGVRLRELRTRLLLENVAGFYDERPSKRRLYAVSSNRKLTPSNQLVLSHELRHALQDQYADVHALLPDAVGDFDDRRMALLSLLEGDATLVMEEFLVHRLPRMEGEPVPDLSGMSLPAPPVEGAPPVLRDQLVLPYVAGLDFARALYKQGGWNALKEAWSHPPESTDQILHPEKYLGHRAPRRVSIPDAPAGGTQVNEGVLGEVFIRTMLGAEDHDTGAGEGWAGDAFKVWDLSGRTLLVWRSVWDTPGMTQAFLAALLGRFSQTHGPGARPGGPWTVFGKGSWSAGVALRDGDVWFVAADDRSVLASALRARP